MGKLSNIILLICSCWCFFACKKTPTILPVDPCQEFRDKGGIGFKILENPAGDIEFEQDTIHIASTAIFQANDIYTSVEWKIAYDPRTFTNKRQRLFFTQLPTEQVPVTMIGHRKPYPDCVPNDDGVDTITKYFMVVTSFESKLLGRFFGRPDDRPNDTGTIRIYMNNFNPTDPTYGWRAEMANFNNSNCTNLPYSNVIKLALAYDFLQTNTDGISLLSNCGFPADQDLAYLKGKMPANDSLIIDYRLSSSNGSVQKWYKWRGKKIL